MPYFKFTQTLTFLVLLFPVFSANAADYPSLEREQTQWIGEQIFSNECNLKIACLTAWNEGESFPSMGVGHFIWFAEGQKEPFQQSFPTLLAYFESQSISIPEWIISEDYSSPWSSREEFLSDFNKPRLTELRQFLQTHIPEQISFIVQRFEQSLGKIIEVSPLDEREVISNRFLQIANSAYPYGLYSLIDYVNFKGEGIDQPEQYNGHGWGLRQVLSNMQSGSGEPLQQFVASAYEVLVARVNNAPANKNETRWLPGWQNRLNTYLPNSLPSPFSTSGKL